MNASRPLLLATLALAALPASALDLRVGTGTGCTHATLQAALDAIEGVGGDHTIRINAGTYFAIDGIVYQPTVAQGFVRLEGGYANCTAAAPSGSPTTDAGRSILDGGGGSGLQRSVLELQINGLVGSFQMRRIALQGGDALASAARFSNGGGLAVFGRASVLIGSGVSIRNNVANNGGGVALVGSRINVNEPLERVDFFIDEGAEIRNNTAAGSGGGIYCGGATAVIGDPPSELRHGSVVHRDGAITGNQANRGAALTCLGSYAAGGWQPRPNPGAIALIANNTNTGTTIFSTAVVSATLDLIVDPVDGVRTLGAIGPTNNGIVLLQGNEAYGTGAVNLEGWGTRGGASPAPATAPAFRMQNVLFIGNRVRPRPSANPSPSALAWFADATLTLGPSSPSMRCGLVPPLGPCVIFEDNAPTGSFASDLRVPAIHSTRQLTIEGARFRGNEARLALVTSGASGTFVALRSSLVDGNLVGGTDTVLFESNGGAGGPADVFLSHVTVTGNSHDRYFRIDGTSRAAIQGTVLHNTGASRPLRFGSAPATNLTLRWCNYLTTLSDSGFTGATQVADSFGPLVTVTGPLAFDAAFNPPLALIDRCQAPTTPAASAPFATPFDVYGNAFGFAVAPANPNRLADLGAVELRPEILLSDGFEAP
jgi:hypothetical protein